VNLLIDLPIDVAPLGRPTRVMVVDDESSIRTFVERVLSEAGYGVRTAAKRFDLFVIAVVMPEMHGYELARQRDGETNVRYFTEPFLEKPVTVAGLLPE
jgi:PleD family two-component response regulator